MSPRNSVQYELNNENNSFDKQDNYLNSSMPSLQNLKDNKNFFEKDIYKK